MPRPDVFHRLHPTLGTGRPPDRDPHSAADPGIRAYRSGFWITVPLQGRERPGSIELTLSARLRGGSEQSAQLGTIEVVPAQAPPEHPPPYRGGRIAICMATFEPDPELFRAQVESLQGQTDDNWVCVISDDCSAPSYFDAIRELVAGDDRFTLHRAAHNVGFYRNFERALGLAPPDAELIALCDQDDRWYPHKLSALRTALGEAGLVYSDQRLVDSAGTVLRETMWEGRRTNHTDLASLLVANTITGAATLFRREIADLALPFPETPGLQFHDHWLGLVALAAGDVAYVDEPLYDYVQHADAVFGNVTSPPPPVAHRARGTLASHLRGGRSAYFLGYLARAVQAETLLVRCADVLTPRKRRVLDRFLAAEGSVAALVWLTARSLRPLWGRNETLGSELELTHALLWRRGLVLGARGTRAPGRRPLDATFPGKMAFEQRRIKRWRSGA